MNLQGKYFSDKAKFHQTLTGIETGTQGVFATCIKGKEARCVGELYSLFDKVWMLSEHSVGQGEELTKCGMDSIQRNSTGHLRKPKLQGRIPTTMTMTMTKMRRWTLKP